MGVVTVITSWRGSDDISIRYPGGKKVLKPPISSECPWKSIDTRWITPGVSMLFVFSHRIPKTRILTAGNLRLTFKFLHDIQKLIINFWSLPEPVLDEIQVREGVGDVERPSRAVCHCRRCRGLRQHGQLGVLAGVWSVHDRVRGRKGCVGMATLGRRADQSRVTCDVLEVRFASDRCQPNPKNVAGPNRTRTPYDAGGSQSEPMIYRESDICAHEAGRGS